MNQPNVLYHEVEKHSRLDVPNFSSEHNTDAFLDWKHHMKAYFGWYDMPKERKLQFVEANLIGTNRIWRTSYKESFSKSDNMDITTWSEMKASMKKRFEPQNFKQRAHI